MLGFGVVKNGNARGLRRHRFNRANVVGQPSLASWQVSARRAQSWRCFDSSVAQCNPWLVLGIHLLCPHDSPTAMRLWIFQTVTVLLLILGDGGSIDMSKCVAPRGSTRLLSHSPMS